MKRYDQVVIGIDQSYRRCGLSVAADGRLLKISRIDLSESDDKTWKRHEVSRRVGSAVDSALRRSRNPPIVVIERIRMFSKDFVSMPYIKQTGALNCTIVDAAWARGVETYSIATKSWKAGSVGSSKPAENDFGVPPEKWPCVEWVISQGFEDAVKLPVEGRRMKGVFIDRDGKKWEYDNDACDSAGIAMSWFSCDPSKFEREL